MKALTILLFAFSASCFEKRELPERYHIILCIGQSNMAGGAVIESQDSNSAAFLWNDHGWEQADGKLNRYTNIPGGNGGLSPANQVGKRLAETPPRGSRIGLVVNAQAGSSITAWSDSLFRKSAARAMEAIAANPNNYIDAIFFQQGEVNINNSQVWLPNFRDMRSQADSIFGPDVPILVGGINWLYHAMNDTIRRVTEIHDCYYVSSDSLLAPDWYHFVSRDQRKFGERFCAVYKQVWH